ncbi:flagellar hook basal-body protein [bacterium]|nr:flagellar hook basal-body protein [bacterium]
MFDLYKNIQNSIGGLTTALRIGISNADNFNTPGFKYTYASFTTVFNTELSAGTETKNPMTVAGSMTLGSTTTDFSQGNIGFGTGLDASIVGEGFFMLSRSAQDFEGGSSKVYSRAGRFQVDFGNKYLTDSFGRKVFGYKLNSSGEIESGELVPMETNGETDIGFVDGGVLVSGFQAHKDAITSGSEDVPAQVPMYRLALTSFANKQGLVIGEGSAYMATAASGDPLTPDIAGGASYGEILGERLESSNIDVAKVALDMALLNRGFTAIQGVIDDLNRILSGLIQKIPG